VGVVCHTACILWVEIHQTYFLLKGLAYEATTRNSPAKEEVNTIA